MDIDHAYRRYRRRSDPRALAMVFDALGPDLLRLAVSILRNGHDAEDAVQETFLTLMQDHERFDGERRVRPWAMGILANRCRVALRRRRKHSAELDQETPSDATDPAAASSAKEFQDRLRIALDEVTEPYRTPLRLRLEDGLRASEIATRLHRRASTVRTQLERGTTQLRQRLPEQIGAFAIAGPAASLERVRTQVFHALGHTEPTAPTGAPSRVGTLGRLGLHPAALLAALGLAALWLFWEPRDNARARPEGEVRVADTNSASASTEGNRAEAEGGRVPSTTPPTTAKTTGIVIVRGLCIDEDDGRPIDGVSVSIEASADRYESVIHPLRFEHVDPAETDAAGRFELRFRPTVIHDLTLVFEHPDRALRRISLGCFAHRYRSRTPWKIWPGRSTDLGHVSLERAIRPEHEVLDDQGEPLPGARFRIVVDAGGRKQFLYGLSEKDGRLRFERPVARLDSAPELFDPRYRILRSDQDRTILAEQPALRGQLLDAGGTAKAWIRLEAVDASGTAIATGRSGRDGRLAIWLPETPPLPLRLRLAGNSTATLIGTTTIPSTDFEPSLTYVPGPRPTPQAELRLLAHEGSPPSKIVLRYRGGSHDDGRSPRAGPQATQKLSDREAKVDLLRLPSGISALVVDADRKLFLPQLLEREDAWATARPIAVELPRSRPFELIIVDGNGEALPDVLVECIAVSSGSVPERGPLADASEAPESRHPLRFDLGFTDEGGRIRLHGPGTVDDLFFRLTSGDGSVHVERAIARPTQRITLEAVVERTGRVTGLSEGRMQLVLTPLDPGTRIVCDLDTDGRFTTTDLSSGIWSARLLSTIEGATRTEQLLSAEFDRFTIRAGESTPIRLDASAVRAGRLVGRVRDAPARQSPRSTLRLEQLSEASALPRTVVLDLSPGSGFRCTGLPPGRYRLRWVPGPRSGASFLTQDLEILPGERTELEPIFTGVACPMEPLQGPASVRRQSEQDTQILAGTNGERWTLWAETGTRVRVSTQGAREPEDFLIAPDGATRLQRDGR